MNDISIRNKKLLIVLIDNKTRKVLFIGKKKDLENFTDRQVYSEYKENGILYLYV